MSNPHDDAELSRTKICRVMYGHDYSQATADEMAACDEMYELIQQRDAQIRLDELRRLTTWRIDNTGDDKYDILYARHKRSYDDRIAALTNQAKGEGK